jgi:hypothetical protein
MAAAAMEESPKAVDPMEKVTFSWKNITVTVQPTFRQKHEPKVILDDGEEKQFCMSFWELNVSF